MDHLCTLYQESIETSLQFFGKMRSNSGSRYNGLMSLPTKRSEALMKLRYTGNLHLTPVWHDITSAAYKYIGIMYPSLYLSCKCSE